MNNYIELEQTEAPFKMIAIEGNIGNEPFDMGGDGYDIHKVRLTNFWMGEHPVTQEVWVTIMDSNPSSFKGDTRPVENVSWEDTQLFLRKLSGRTGREYRLPTEAEWEYASKGGQYWQEFPFQYVGGDKLNEVGWYDANSHGETKPVGLKTPNLLGLYDMSGNVWEWCEDWYNSDFYKECEQQGVVIDPCNRKEGRSRVIRGGGWISSARHCRPSYRDSNTPSFRFNNIGFRVVLSFPSV